MEDRQDSSRNKPTTQPNMTTKFTQYLDQNQENKEMDIFSTDQIFNMRSSRLNDDGGNQKEYISNNASSLADNKPMNGDKKITFSKREEDSDTVKAKKLVGSEFQRFSLIPQSSQQDYEKNNATMPPCQLVFQDSQAQLSRLKEGTDDERLQSSSRKKTHTQTMNNSSKKVFNLKTIAEIKKKVVYFYKNFTSFGRKNYLSNLVVRNMINDNSDIIQLDKNVFFVLRILHDIKYRLKRVDLHVDSLISLFSPHGYASYILLRLFATYNQLFYLIFSIMIIFHGPEEFQYIFYPITLVVWILEAAFHMNTQIYIKNQIVSDRFHIVANYIKIRAIYDFISFIILIILPTIESYRNIFYIFSFIKLVNTMKDVDEIQRDLICTIKNYYMVSLVNLIIRIFVIGHVVACMWYLVGQIELIYLGEPETWYASGLAVEKNWWILYLEAMYWSLTLLTTGSNIATTIFQMFFTTFVMIFTTIIFGYLLNVTGVIISSLDEQNESMRKDLNIVNDYMRSNKISKKIISQVNTDIENYYKSDMNKQLDNSQEIFQKISPTLLNKLREEYCNQILDKFPIIRFKFSKDTLDILSHELEEVYYLPHQQILEEGQLDNFALMYIVQGSVELTQSFLDDTKTQKTIQKLKKGSIFGGLNFFTGLAPDKSAKSSEFTKIMKIDRQKFINIVKDDEKDYQVFCEIKDMLLNYEKYDIIDQKCLFCQNSTHLEAECHLVHIQKDEIFQKLRFFENKKQTRETFARKQSYLKTYSSIQKVENEIEFFRLSRNEVIDSLDYVQQHKINVNITHSDYTNSDYDDDYYDDNMCGSQTEIESQTGTQRSPRNKKDSNNEDFTVNNDTKTHTHNRSYDILDPQNKKLQKQSSMLSPVLNTKNNLQNIIKKQITILLEEGLLDLGTQPEKHTRKALKTLSFLQQEKQKERQKRGSLLSKQSTINIRTNHSRDEEEDVGIINLNEEQDDQVNPLPTAVPKKKNSKVPNTTKNEQQMNKSSQLSKFKMERQNTNNTLQLMINNNSILSNVSHQKPHKASKQNKLSEGQILNKIFDPHHNHNLQLAYFKQMDENQNIIHTYLEWAFDKAIDLKYYFVKGNSKAYFQRYQKYQRKKLKLNTIKKSKYSQQAKLVN